MAKKILIISGSIFIVILAVFFVKKIFFSSSEKEIDNNTGAKNDQNKQEETTNGQNEKFVEIIDGPVSGAVLDPKTNQIVFYQNQKVLVADPEGEINNSIGAYPFGDVEWIEWSKDNKKALIKDNQGFWFYSLDNDQATPLKSGLDSVIWDASGERVIYKYYDDQSKERSINISDPDGNNWTTLIERVSFIDVALNIQSMTDKICYHHAPDSKTVGQLECVERTPGSQSEIVHEGGFGADYLWSKNGKRLLISMTQAQAGNRMILGVANEKGGEYKGLSFPTTVKKCVWSSDNIYIYCAMMSPAPEQALLPNDWQEGKYEFVDTFWKINTENGKKERFVENDEITKPVDSKRLFLSHDESYLFFVDKRTEALYRIAL